MKKDIAVLCGLILLGLVSYKGYRSYSENTNASLEEHKEAEDFGLKQVPISCQNSICELSLSFISQSKCFFGDMDFIKAELSAPDSQVLLSLEPIQWADTQMHPSIMKLTKENLVGGTTKLPFELSPQVETLGLFVCLDREKKGFCNLKPYVDPERGGTAVAGYPKEPKPAMDRIVYFQFLFLDAKKKLRIIDLSQTASEEVKKLEKSLSRVMRTGLLKGISILESLRPASVKIQNNELLLILPELGKDCPKVNRP